MLLKSDVRKLFCLSISSADRLLLCFCAVPYDSMQRNIKSRQHLIGS